MNVGLILLETQCLSDFISSIKCEIYKSDNILGYRSSLHMILSRASSILFKPQLLLYSVFDVVTSNEVFKIKSGF